MTIEKKKKEALKKAAIILIIAFGGAGLEKYAGVLSQVIDLLLGFL